MFDELLEVGHDQKGFPGRVTYAPLEEPWNLQIGQLQKIFYTKPNMSNENLTSYSLASGLFDELLEVGHDQKGFPGRVTYAPLEEPWNLQIGQLQKIFYTKPNMSNENLTSYSLASGEYISIHLKPWIISTTKEKEVTTLHYACPNLWPTHSA